MAEQLWNETKQAVAAERLRVARRLDQRFLGLMGRSRLPAGEAMLIAPCNSIHTLFMRFRVDAVFIDREGTVAKVCRGVRPFWLAFGGRGSHAVVEFPAGGAHGIERGDRLIQRAAADARQAMVEA